MVSTRTAYLYTNGVGVDSEWNVIGMDLTRPYRVGMPNLASREMCINHDIERRGGVIPYARGFMIQNPLRC
jgi:hypothetical protein